VKSRVLAFGVLGGLLIAILKLVEYRYLVVEHSVEIYGGIVAATFAAVGVWLGRKLTRTVVREVPVEVPVEVPIEVRVPVEVPVPVSGPFVRDERKVAALGLTPRELEILEQIALGLSTREIASRVHVSENTVKTHASRVFDKLGARRRTQAVQLGKEFRLIP
jgi:NarL family two-component system response regulator LiaR